MLKNWNDGLQAVKPAIQHPDADGPLALYGSAFAPEDLPTLPPEDLPAGTPAWMRTKEGWAVRKGESALEKRRTIPMRVTEGVIPRWRSKVCLEMHKLRRTALFMNVMRPCTGTCPW